MKNKLYLEGYSGISGDMMVAALLDLGADEAILNQALNSLPFGGFVTKVSRVKKAGLDVCDFAVILDGQYENYDHDMEYLHGDAKHKNTHHHHHHASDESGQQMHHAHSHSDHMPLHKHEHRSLPEIIDIIEQTAMSDAAKQIARNIFQILAEAEAKAHGTALNEVHFHEVGAIDSIVDIIAVAVCVDNLGIEEVIVPVLYEGTGFVRCQHGILPVPVPAVSNIISNYGLKLRITNTEGEFVTPTGAAIAAALKTSDQLPEQFSIVKIGIGAGKRNYERPSLLRAMLIMEDSYEADEIYKLESNIDDCSGEALGYVMERLLNEGAKDVYYMPIYMKKNRPAYQLNVMCKKEEIKQFEKIIFEETTTIGIRKQKMERTVLKREIQKISTSLGEVQVKICDLPSGKRYYAEYNSIVELCKKHKMSYQDVYQIVMKDCSTK